MQTNPAVLNSIRRNQKHLDTDNCKNLVASGAQRASALKAAAVVGRTREFTIYGERLESVETINYLGHLLAMLKALKVWKRLDKLLRSKSEGASCISPYIPRVVKVLCYE